MGQRGLICVSVMAADNRAIFAAVQSVVSLADVIEIRMDALREPLSAECIGAIAKPVLATHRPAWEGGHYSGSEEQRIDLLCAALRNGARYVDIELRTDPELRSRILAEARTYGGQVVISSHDFNTTPTAAILRKTLEAMIASSADIGKIVTTAATPADTLRILALQQEAMAAGFALSAFAMGKAGTISRLATLYLGGFMTYASLTPDQATAPGQITIHNLHGLLALLDPAR